jgi:hypothetical protein
MANRETSELGGEEGVVIFIKGLISWVFIPVLGA